MSIVMKNKTERSRYTTHIKIEEPKSKFRITIFDHTMKELIQETRTSLKGAFDFAERWINEQ